MEHLVSYEFYTEDYGGNNISQEDFDKIRNTAEEVILALINPCFVIEKNLNDIKYAICLEIDYLYENGFEKISTGKDSINYQSESYPRLFIY